MQPGLRGFAKTVMQTFGMVPETEAEHRHERHSLARSSHSGGGAHRHAQVERMRSMRSTVIPFHDLSPPHRYAIPQLPPATRQRSRPGAKEREMIEMATCASTRADGTMTSLLHRRSP